MAGELPPGFVVDDPWSAFPAANKPSDEWSAFPKAQPAAAKQANNLPPGFVVDDLPDAPWAKPANELPDAPWAKSAPASSGWTDYLPRAVTDIWPEIKRSTSEAVQGVKQNLVPSSIMQGGRDFSNEGTLEGLGKTGSGIAAAASVPFAPIVGAARSLIGHPMASAVHGVGSLINPEVASKQTHEQIYEDARTGVDTALMGMGPRGYTPRGAIAPTPVPATPRQLLAEASERQGVPLSRAAATDSIPVQASAGALKEVPIVGAPLVRSSRRSLQEMDRAVSDTVSGYGSGQPMTAGEAATQGIESWVTGKSQAVADRLYNNVDALVDPTHTRPMHATEKAVADIMARRANARIQGSSKAVDEVLEGIQTPGGMNYSGLKDLRSYIGEMTPEEMVAKGISKSEAKRIYGAMTEDLRGTVLDAGGPDALKAFDRANSVYQAIATRRAALSKIIGVKADAAPERVMARITEMASSKGGANYTGLCNSADRSARNSGTK